MDRSTVRNLAALCKLSLDDAQEARAEAHMGRLLEYFDMLQAVDTDGVEPSPYPMTLPHRPRAGRCPRTARGSCGRGHPVVGCE